MEVPASILTQISNSLQEGAGCVMEGSLQMPDGGVGPPALPEMVADLDLFGLNAREVWVVPSRSPGHGSSTPARSGSHRPVCRTGSSSVMPSAEAAHRPHRILSWSQKGFKQKMLASVSPLPSSPLFTGFRRRLRYELAVDFLHAHLARAMRQSGAHLDDMVLWDRLEGGQNVSGEDGGGHQRPGCEVLKAA